MTAPLAGIELDRTAIQAALAALREGRSTGSSTLDQVANALGRRRARAWAHFRRAWPDVAEVEIDIAANMTVDVLASVPALVVMLLVADTATRAAAGGAS